jgi:hypothetical protein
VLTRRAPDDGFDEMLPRFEKHAAPGQRAGAFGHIFWTEGQIGGQMLVTLHEADGIQSYGGRLLGLESLRPFTQVKFCLELSYRQIQYSG